MKSTLTVYLSLLVSSYAAQIRLKVHPSPEDPESGLIWYNQSTTSIWTKKLNNFLDVYGTPLPLESRDENLVSCNYDKYPKPDKVCRIRSEDFKPCTAKNFYGYKNGTPCVFIEIDNVLDWKPKFFSSLKSLPKGMPESLKNHIEESIKANVKKWETIWVSCEGLTPADKEFIGSTNILPQPGFPGYYFPYTGQNGYLNPIIAIHFQNPQRGVIITVVCKAWAPGIVHDLNKPLGLTTFELLYD